MLALITVTLVTMLATPLALMFIWFAENTPHQGEIDPLFYWILLGPWTVLASIWGFVLLRPKDSN